MPLPKDHGRSWSAHPADSAVVIAEAGDLSVAPDPDLLRRRLQRRKEGELAVQLGGGGGAVAAARCRSGSGRGISMAQYFFVKTTKALWKMALLLRCKGYLLENPHFDVAVLS